MRTATIRLLVFGILFLLAATDCSAFTRELTINASSSGVAADSKGNIYTVYLYTFTKYDKNGNLVHEINAAPNVVGYADMVFFNGVTVGPDDAVYVSILDGSSKHAVRKYSTDMALLLEFGSSGSGDGQFDDNKDLAVDQSGNIFVADVGNNRIQKFDAHGNFLTKWGEYGSETNQFLHIRSLSTDKYGNLYVADGNSSSTKLQKFTNNGVFVYLWDESPSVSNGVMGPIKGNFIVRSPNGMFLMVGTNWYQKYSDTRELLDTKVFDDSTYGTDHAPFIADNGLIYAVGSDHLFVYNWDFKYSFQIVAPISMLLLQ